MRDVNRILGIALLAALTLPSVIWAEDNPAAPGFDAAASDARAVEIADEVMAALGGRGAWDRTRYITWKFFGNRLHVWDKHTGDIRVEWKDRRSEKQYVALMNLNNKEGRAWEEGAEVTEAEALAAALRRAEGAWINDAYWLLMPYKLKDSGVTLRHLGERADEAGAMCDVLELTFKEVGRTPQNKYHVFIDKTSRFVTNWDYWKDRSVDESRSLGPWQNWRAFGEIMLTDDHGKRKHTDVAVLKSLPKSVFTEPPAFVLADHQ